MRKETNKEYIVRTTTTGYVEADMLGHTLNIAEEMSAKQKSSQRPHRNDMIKSKLSACDDNWDKLSGVLKWSLTAPSACWRSLKVLKGKGKEIYNRVASRVRKLFVNGK